MRNFPTFIMIFLLSIFFTSCEEDFILKRDEFQPSIVVNSVFKPGEKWMIHVSKSRDILESHNTTVVVSDATVLITENKSQKKIYLTHIGDGIYSTDYYPPESDKAYILSVEVPGFDKVTARSMAPAKANVINISTEIVNKDVSTVNFQISNKEDQYLMWNLINSKNGSPEDEVIYSGNPKGFITDYLMYNNYSYMLPEITGQSNDAISSDGTFSIGYNNQDSEDEDSDNIDSNIDGESGEIIYKKYLRIVTASSDLYNYYKTVEKFLFAENHNSSFSVTPQIYSNVENGLGIFAGYTEEFKEIE